MTCALLLFFFNTYIQSCITDVSYLLTTDFCSYCIGSASQQDLVTATIKQSYHGVDNDDVLFCQLCAMEFSSLKTKMAHFCGKPHCQELMKKLCDVLNKQEGVGEKQREGRSDKTMECSNSSMKQQQQQQRQEQEEEEGMTGEGREEKLKEKEVEEEVQSSCSSGVVSIDEHSPQDSSSPCVESSYLMETSTLSQEEERSEETCSQADSIISGGSGKEDEKTEQSDIFVDDECTSVALDGEVGEAEMEDCNIDLEDCNMESDEGQCVHSSPSSPLLLKKTTHLNPEDCQLMCSNLDEYLLHFKGQWTA